MRIERRWVLIAVAVIGLLVAGPLAAQTVIQNGDFTWWASSTEPLFWIVEDTGNTWVDSTSDAHNTAPGCRFTRRVAGSGNNSGLYQMIAVTGGQACYIGAWMKTPTMPDTMIWSRGGIFVSWYKVDTLTGDTTFLRSTTPKYVHSDTWVYVDTVFTALDTANLAKVAVRAYGRTGGLAGGIVLVDDVSFPELAVEEGGAPVAALSPVEVAPNPFSTVTMVRFAARATVSARLKVYDATGQVVRELANGPSRTHTFRFDGRDAGGRDLPGGIYFAAVEVGAAQHAVQKLLLLR